MPLKCAGREGTTLLHVAAPRRCVGSSALQEVSDETSSCLYRSASLRRYDELLKKGVVDFVQALLCRMQAAREMLVAPAADVVGTDGRQPLPPMTIYVIYTKAPRLE